MRLQALMPAVAVLIVLSAGASGAAPVQTSQVGKIADRSLLLMSQDKEETVEINTVKISRRLDGERSSLERQMSYQAFREPGLYWSETISSDGYRGVSCSDGKVLQDFNVLSDSANAGKEEIVQTVLLEKDYESMGGHAFRRLTAFGLAAAAISRVLAMTTDADRKYLGRQAVRGEDCDVLQFDTALADVHWAKTRAMYSAAPEKALTTTKLYIRVSDGRLLRKEENAWMATQVGEDWVYNTRTDSQADFSYGPALPAADFTAGRFELAVKGITGGRMPKVAQTVDEWKGKSLPEVNGLATLDGKPVSWKDFHGKVLVIETWFIGCGYCKQAFPYYEKLRRQLEGQGVAFMAFNTGEAKTNSAQDIKKWMAKSREKYGFFWTTSAESPKELEDKLKVVGAPGFFVVGTDGAVIASYTGFGYGDGGVDPRLNSALREAGVTL